MCLWTIWLVGSWRALLTSAAIPFDARLTLACLRRDQRLPVDFARPEGLVQAEVSWGQARASARKPYTGACPLRNPALPQPGHALWLWRGPLR